MNKITAQTKNNEIIINGYLNNGNIIISDKGIKADFICDSYIDEREMSDLYQSLIDQLGAQGKAHSEICKLIDGQQIEIELSTQLDIDDIRYDLDNEGEAKINITGDSDLHIAKLMTEIKHYIGADTEIFIESEKSRKGYKSTYIRICA